MTVGSDQRLLKTPLLAPARTLRAKAKCLFYEVPLQDYFRAKNILYDVTNSITEIPKVGVQLPEQWVTLHLHVAQVLLCTRPSHPVLEGPSGFSLGMLPANHREVIHSHWTSECEFSWKYQELGVFMCVCVCMHIYVCVCVCVFQMLTSAPSGTVTAVSYATTQRAVMTVSASVGTS